MHTRIALLATAGMLCLGGCAATHSMHPRPLVARAEIHGMTRLQTHHLLASYCTSNGYAIVHDSLTALACSRRDDGVAKSYLAQTLDASLESHVPVRTLHFRFAPDGAGSMHIQATASTRRANRDGMQQASVTPLADVAVMLQHARAAWYARHPEYAELDRS